MIPDGELRRSRVLTDLSPALEDALEQRLDGYALVSPLDALLGDADECGVITFEAGVATLAGVVFLRRYGEATQTTLATSFLFLGGLVLGYVVYTGAV